jgi:hypothetical protein
MEALVVCQALFVNDVAACVEGEVVHDDYWGNVGMRDSVNLILRPDQAIVVLHVA